MAATTNGIPWYAARALEKSARLGGAANIYSHLSTDADLAAAQVRRNQFAGEMRELHRLMQTGLPEDKPVTASRPRVTQDEAARAMYPYLGEEANRARERYEQWQERMLPRGFSLKRAPQGGSDWWSRKGK
jgi:hypothetical protein